MRLFLAPLLIVLISGNAPAEDWTIQGRTYHNVEVQNVTADHAEITFDGGVGSPKLTDLPPDLQKRFGATAPQEPDTTAALAEIRKNSGHILVAKIGGTDIQLPEPPGMVELPPGHPMIKVAQDMTPADSILLRSCVTAADLKEHDDTTPIAFQQTFAIKEAPMDIPSGEFIEIVEKLAQRTSGGILISQDSSFNYVETQKRLEIFRKDTGITLAKTGNYYSLGIVSRSDACVSYMTSQDLDATYKGKSERVECLSIIAYLRLKKKVVLTLTTMTLPLFYREDLRTLKESAEKYQLALQVLNNM